MPNFFEVDTIQTVVNTITEQIEFKTIVEQIDTLELGTTLVAVEGVEGVREKVIQTEYLDGEVVSQVIVSDVITAEPINKIIHEGVMVPEPEPEPEPAYVAPTNTTVSAGTIVCSQTGAIYEIANTYTMEATAYTNIPNSRWYGITASGLPTFVGMVAVDKNVIPLGTILYVEGYGIAIAGDTGSAINGYDIDLFMNSYNEAITFGRRNVTVHKLADQSLDVQAIRSGQ